jgi:hypothetical protein
VFFQTQNKKILEKKDLTDEFKLLSFDIVCNEETRDVVATFAFFLFFMF